MMSADKTSSQVATNEPNNTQLRSIPSLRLPPFRGRAGLFLEAETMLTETLQAAMCDAREAVQANNTDPDVADLFTAKLKEYANSTVEIDAEGDVWDHDNQGWWNNETAERFLAWIADQ